MDEEVQALNADIPFRDIQEQVRQIDLQESPVREDGSLVIIGADEDPTPTRRNRPFRIQITTFLTFMALTAGPTMETYLLWIDREGEWGTNDIPLLVTDQSNLRLHVWTGSLPNPLKHARAVLLRLNWMGDHIPDDLFIEWFLRHARGSPEVDQRDTHHRSRRCLLCGSHVIGYPVDNHRHTDCLFSRLPAELRLRFIAINHRAFCPHCGCWSTTHAQCPHKRCDCGASDHQPCQGQCARQGGPAMTTQEQDRIAYNAISAHYARCEELRQTGQAEYLCPGDAPSRHTRSLFENLRQNGQYLALLGFAKFIHMFDQWIPTHTAYRSRTLFSGLITPEESSASVNSHPLFLPEEVDRVLMYGMITDQIRFGNFWFPGRRGNQPILTLPDNLGRRAQLQAELPPVQPELPPEEPEIPQAPLPEAAPPILPPRPPVVAPPQVPQEERPQLQMRDAIERLARERQRQPQMEPHAQDHENQGDGAVLDPPNQNMELPDSPEIRPGQRRANRSDEDEDDSFSTESPDNSFAEASPEESDAEANSSPEDSEQGNPLFPVITEFDRTSNQWFQFFTQQPMLNEHNEFQQESEYNARTVEQLSMEARTLQVTTPAARLQELATRRIPHHLPSIKARILFLERSLVGYWRTSFPEGNYRMEELQSYVAYLQGAHAFLATLMHVDHALPVKINSCLESLEDPQKTHELVLADLETFHWHEIENHFFIIAENHWHRISEHLQRNGCGCTRIPRNEGGPEQNPIQ